MATIIVDSADTIEEVIDKINDLSTQVGDLTLLEETSSSMVEAVNNYFFRIRRFDDSSEQIAITRRTFSVVQSGDTGSLSYNRDTGAITYTGTSVSEARAIMSFTNGLSVSNGEVSIEDSSLPITYLNGEAITSNKYTSSVVTDILNSAGNIITTFRTPEA